VKNQHFIISYANISEFKKQYKFEMENMGGRWQEPSVILTSVNIKLQVFHLEIHKGNALP